MPRPPRVQIAGATYHVTTRGNHREAIYRDNGDRRAFLATLALVVKRHRWQCHAYCLMTTHYHIVLTTPAADLARGMHRLNGNYARSFNHRHGERGHLFERRYRSLVVENDAHFLQLSRYVALNPVAAGLSADPLEWRWSSHRAAVGLVPCPSFLATDALLAYFGDDPERARTRLRAFVDDGLDGGGLRAPELDRQLEDDVLVD